MAKTIKLDKNGLPKRIAGVKVPKGLRQPAGMLVDKANTPEGRALIGKGVAATMAFVLAARAQAAHAPAPVAPETPERPTPPAPPVPPVPPVADEPRKPGADGTTTAPDLDKAVEAIGVAADAVFKRLFGKIG